ncbi:sulfotransferase [uncultured Marivita sp.]|uniref:sulfotransferase family protein n=1 Tax=uncultured Marivita sp. TaxID=888080 RepID=UPI002603782C|nr:sulfotransferase [uncultured Marivita sp.]
MAQRNAYATEIPEFPNEVNLTQAIGLIPKIAPYSTEQALKDRLRIHDPVIRVFALAALLKQKYRFDQNVLTVALHVARRSAFLRQILISELIGQFRFDLVEKVIEMQEKVGQKGPDLRAALMTSELKNDYETQVKLHEALYIETGNILHIDKAAELARERLPWKIGAQHIVRMIFMQDERSLEPSVISLLQCLDREGAKKEFISLFPIIQKLETCQVARAYCYSMRLFWSEKYRECLDFLEKSNALEATKDKSPLLSNIAATCYEKLGQYEDSARWYQIQNEAQKDERFQPEAFLSGVKERAAIEIPRPIPDAHDRYFIMTGFPRSGTTLLENALSAHPRIATCEETSSLIGSFAPAFLAPLESDPERKKIMLRLAYHQSLYYQNINRFVKKDDAEAIIDKTPIISANIKYMEKIFPNKRYIFSIRHPYDVVLSNLKQVYSQNSAMSAFNDVKSACVLYNAVMSDWFEVFPSETDRVCYVKYDDLVENFKFEMERVLKFLSVDWTDEVLNFVEHSQKRAVRTPSYKNVRKGLTIGVQTSWQNFDFLFDSDCRSLLDPWVERFEY